MDWLQNIEPQASLAVILTVMLIVATPIIKAVISGVAELLEKGRSFLETFQKTQIQLTESFLEATIAREKEHKADMARQCEKHQAATTRIQEEHRREIRDVYESNGKNPNN